MTKRGYKLQEFVAHSSNVNCISIAKKACRLFITGGDDWKVNLWTIGKPSSLMCLSGHTSPVESLAFEPAEVLVVAGASSGAIKLWDLNETKLVRSLSGHISHCTAVEFHPFGEFFASGSSDMNLKIWDIRKKGCIHTYKGHTGGINSIRFTPDGRWIVTGGADSVVKVWDLTAGKHLHDFKLHEGPICSINFHPLEFLLATGSADRTVKFWDLETFELIGSTSPEASELCAISFNPDGKTLFCGLDESLKVFSWEPVVCHDAIDLGWSTLGDLCVHETKLLGCSYYRNSVAVWVADISLIKPYGISALLQETVFEEKMLDRAAINEDVKNIYVDCADGKSFSSRSDSSFSSEVSSPAEFQSRLRLGDQNSGTQASDSSSQTEMADSSRETVSFSKTKPGMLLRPSHVRKSPHEKDFPVPRAESMVKNTENVVSGSDSEKRSSAKASCSTLAGGTVSSPKSGDSIKIVNGVAVVHGRTRTLVEKFERQERLVESCTTTASSSVSELNDTTPMVSKVITPFLPGKFESGREDTSTDLSISEGIEQSPVETREEINPSPIASSEKSGSEKLGIDDQLGATSPSDVDGSSSSLAEIDPAPQVNEFEKQEKLNSDEHSNEEHARTASSNAANNLPPGESHIDVSTTSSSSADTSVLRLSSPSTFRSIATSGFSRAASRGNVSGSSSSVAPRFGGSTRGSKAFSRVRSSPYNGHQSIPRSSPNTTYIRHYHNTDRKLSPTNPYVTESVRSPPSASSVASPPETSILIGELVSGRESVSFGSIEVSEITRSHDEFLSTLKSRLRKLKMIRHFWDRNDMKGAIDALKNMPDYSVQADVVSFLTEKTEVITLDLFSLVLPVLVGLLDSKTDRHVCVALELALKLVSVFGPVVRSTISALPAVGVDLHAEERRESCILCHRELQKVLQIIPTLSRRSGLLAKSALELNLVLQES